MESLQKVNEERVVKTTDSACTEMKIKFENFQKFSKRLFKITLPTDVLSQNGVNSICPVAFCQKKIPKTCSFEDHIRDHLNVVYRKVVTDCEIEPKFDVTYHCFMKDCKYSDVNDTGKCFFKVKYLKQHYLKVHSPKDFKCSACHKAFASQSNLEIHASMCGILYKCTCGSTYSTFESLQTHVRRKKHSIDLNMYKDIPGQGKSRQEMQITELASKKESNNGNNTTAHSTVCLLTSKKLQMILPKSLPGSTVYNGGSQLEDQRQFGINSKSQVPKKSVDCETQTGSQHIQKKSSGPKRKKSAETQTARVRVRVSTETQTTNVVKRRRSTRKKQSAEAQTQCHHEGSQAQSCQNQAQNQNHQNEIPSPTCQNEVQIENCQNEITTNKVDMSVQVVRDCNPTLCSNNEDSNINNPMLELGLDSDPFFKDMEEAHIQTQTDPDLLFLDNDNIFSEYDAVNNFNGTDDFFLNLVTTETQTANPSISYNNLMDSATDPLPFETAHSSEPFPSDEQFKTSNYQNSSYLETMDNETQTQFYDCLFKMWDD